MNSVKTLLTLFALGALLYWTLSPSSPSENAEETFTLQEFTVGINEKEVGPAGEEFEDLQQAHLNSLDVETPFAVEYTYPQSEELSKEAVAQHESRRVLERRWEEIRAFNEGELPELTEEDKIITTELMRQEGLTSVYEDR